MYRAKNVCSTPEILAKEMDYLHQVLSKTTYQIGSSKNQKGILQASPLTQKLVWK